MLRAAPRSTAAGSRKGCVKSLRRDAPRRAATNRGERHPTSRMALLLRSVRPPLPASQVLHRSSRNGTRPNGPSDSGRSSFTTIAASSASSASACLCFRLERAGPRNGGLPLRLAGAIGPAHSRPFPLESRVGGPHAQTQNSIRGRQCTCCAVAPFYSLAPGLVLASSLFALDGFSEASRA